VLAVLDVWIRYRLGGLIPLLAGPWSAQVPVVADLGRHAYVTEIARAEPTLSRMNSAFRMP
jgi:hypothetical protein